MGRGTGDLVVASHRLPIAVEDGPGGLSWSKSPGGLVAALENVLSPRDLWVGTVGREGAFDAALGAAEAGIDTPCRLRAVPITGDQFRDYYLGFSNQIVWPLFHDFLPYCQYDDASFRSFREVNQRFADAIIDGAPRDATVWVQDYHLLDVARALRERGHEGRIGLFLHIPFPTNDSLSRCPWKEHLVGSMLHFDLLGFQTDRDVRHFVRCATATSDVSAAAVPGGWALQGLRGRTMVSAFPVGIDVGALQEEWPLEEHVKARRQREPGMKYLLGLERLDYTKGTLERLRAFDRLLRQHPELHGKVTLVQHVDPSREDIARYAGLREQIERLVGRINGRHGNLFWSPVHFSYRRLDRSEVLRLYSIADVALVTPLRDGMNLVAKEYAATQWDEDGVLVLSCFAGAAEELAPGAIVVNPHDGDALAQAMHDALHMPRAERQRRMRFLRDSVRHNDAQAWAKGFLSGLSAVEAWEPAV